jgi:hypothetical protein
MYEHFQRRLEQLKATGAVSLGPGCPSETGSWRVAAGVLPKSEEAEWLEHSTRSDACGLLLRQATEGFAEEQAEGEIAYLSELPRAPQEYLESVARRLRAAQTDRGG